MLREKLADLVMPWAARNASVWPSQHATHRVLMEQLRELADVDAAAERIREATAGALTEDECRWYACVALGAEEPPTA